MEWKPIDTAPVNTQVQCGKWDIYDDRKTWKQTEGMPFTSRLWGLVRVREYHGRQFSHWRPLPPPPGEGDV